MLSSAKASAPDQDWLTSASAPRQSSRPCCSCQSQRRPWGCQTLKCPENHSGWTSGRCQPGRTRSACEQGVRDAQRAVGVSGRAAHLDSVVVKVRRIDATAVRVEVRAEGLVVLRPVRAARLVLAVLRHRQRRGSRGGCGSEGAASRGVRRVEILSVAVDSFHDVDLATRWPGTVHAL